MKPSAVRAAAILALFLSPVAARIAAQNSATRFRGIIESFDGQILRVRTPDGQSNTVTIPADLKVKANEKTVLSKIKVGDYVGSSSNRGADGKMHAEEIHLFPEIMRGAAEGYRPLNANGERLTPGSADFAVPPRAMTNGVVAGLTGDTTATLTIQYKDGRQVVEIAPDTPIFALVVVERSLLKSGATATVMVSPRGGGWVANDLITEKDGIKPR